MIDAQGRVDTALQITQEHMERCDCETAEDAALALHALLNATTYALVIAAGRNGAIEVLQRAIASTELMASAQPGTLNA